MTLHRLCLHQGQLVLKKAVPQTFRNHYASAIGCKESLGFDRDTNWLSVLPIYHISGLSVLLRAVIEGFTVRIVDKFNAEQILTMIKMNASHTFRLCHKL